MSLKYFIKARHFFKNIGKQDTMCSYIPIAENNYPFRPYLNNKIPEKIILNPKLCTIKNRSAFRDVYKIVLQECFNCENTYQ